MKLRDKIVVVTGGSGLIGRSIIAYLTEQGCKAINADLHVENDFDAGSAHLDITKPESVDGLIQALVDRYGRIDGWVNNAYPRTKDWGLRAEEVPFESWKTNVDLQLNSYYYCCTAIIRQMVAQGGGSIVNMSSIYGINGPDFTVYEGTGITNPVAYSAIKAGIINLSKYFASYYGGRRVRVNALSPGGIFDNQHPTFVANYEKKVPLQRMGQPDEMAGPVAFLLSDEASYITGHNLVVDGGWTAV